jgi:Xaa-Pro aminopeptidase
MLVNLDRAYQMMDRYGIDVIIASTPENLLYFADYAPWNVRTYRGNTPSKGMQAYAVIPRSPDIEPSIIPMGSNYTVFVYPAQFPGWVTDFYPYSPDSAWPGDIPDVPDNHNPDTPAEMIRLRELTEKFKGRAVKTPGRALVKALKEKGLDRATAAFESFGASPDAISCLKTELPNLKLKEAAEFIRLIRAVKTPQEIYYLRRCGEINEKAFRHIHRLMYPGITTAELAHEHSKIVTEEGAHPSFLNISAIERPGTIWQPSDYALRKGDVVWMDGGCEYHHYHSDTGMSLVIGEADEKMTAAWNAVEAAMAAAKNACRPGALSSKVHKALYDSLKEHGIEKPFAMGHGVGLEERDYPLALGAFGGLGATNSGQFSDEILSGSNDIELEPNMVMCVEVNCFEWGVGGIKAEQTLLVTKNGCELLFPHDRVLKINR